MTRCLKKISPFVLIVLAASLTLGCDNAPVGSALETIRTADVDGQKEETKQVTKEEKPKEAEDLRADQVEKLMKTARALSHYANGQVDAGPVGNLSVEVQDATKMMREDARDSLDVRPKGAKPYDADRLQTEQHLPHLITETEEAKEVTSPQKAQAQDIKSPKTSHKSDHTGGLWIKIGAYKKQETAEEVYRTLVKKKPLQSLKAQYETVRLTGKETVVRLKMGPFASKERARHACESAGIYDAWCSA